MNTRSLTVVRAALPSLLLSSFLLVSPAGAATPASHGTFSGVVSRVSAKSINVRDSASHRTLSFLTRPDGWVRCSVSKRQQSAPDERDKSRLAFQGRVRLE